MAGDAVYPQPNPGNSKWFAEFRACAIFVTASMR